MHHSTHSEDNQKEEIVKESEGEEDKEEYPTTEIQSLPEDTNYFIDHENIKNPLLLSGKIKETLFQLQTTLNYSKTYDFTMNMVENIVSTSTRLVNE